MAEEKDYLKESLSAINQADYPKAEEMLNEGLEHSPQNEKLLNLLGWVLFQREKYEEMISAYKRLVKINPQQSFTMFFNLGKAYFQLKDYQSAIEAFTKTIEQVPDHKNALFYLSAAYENIGDLKTSKKILSNLVNKGKLDEPIRDISMQEGIGELDVSEMAEQCRNCNFSDQPLFTRVTLFGTWSIAKEPIVLWNGGVETENFIEHVVMKGEARLLLAGEHRIFVLDKNEELLVNGRYFSGVDNLFEGAFNKKSILKIKGPRKVIIGKVPCFAEDIGEKDHIKTDRLIAVYGAVKIKNVDDGVAVVQKGTGKAFLF